MGTTLKAGATWDFDFEVTQKDLVTGVETAIELFGSTLEFRAKSDVNVVTAEVVFDYAPPSGAAATAGKARVSVPKTLTSIPEGDYEMTVYVEMPGSPAKRYLLYQEINRVEKT